MSYMFISLVMAWLDPEVVRDTITYNPCAPLQLSIVTRAYVTAALW